MDRIFRPWRRAMKKITGAYSATKKCPVCNENMLKHAKICHSAQCDADRKCVQCGEPIPGSVRFRCAKCFAARKLENNRKAWKRRNIYKPKKPKCQECPSLSKFGRCGAVTSGERQWVPAMEVKDAGECPRENGIRAELDAMLRSPKPLLKKHEKTCGHQSTLYIDPIPAP